MFKKKLERFFSGESGNVFRGMLTLFMGAGLARIIGIVSIPVLTRIYAPDDYGVLALYVSFVSILTPVLSLRYVTAIPLPRTDRVAFQLFAVCFQLIVASSCLIAVLLFFFKETIFSWFNMQALVPWWWLIVIGAAGSALYELFNLWATRKKQYKIIAQTQFGQSLIGNLVKIILGLLAIKPAGLIVGQFISQSAGIGNFIKNSFYEFKLNLLYVKKRRALFVAKYYQQFVWFRLPSQFLMVLSVQAPVMMMAALYDKEVTGQLSLAILALSLPVQLVGQATGRAYYAEVASIGRADPEQVRKITVDVQKKLFALGIPATIIVLFLAQPMFKMVFGEKWALAGKFAAILSPYMLLQFTSNPLVQVLNVLGSQLMFLIINVTRIIGLGVIWAILNYIDFNATYYVTLISCYLFIYYLIMTLLIFKLVDKSAKKLSKT